MHNSGITTGLALIVCTGILWLSAGPCLSDEAGEKTYSHAFWGQMVIDETASELEEDTQSITIFGADAQRSYTGGLVELGMETGAILSWDSSLRYLKASSGGNGGSVAVAVTVDSFMIDYFFGGFVGLKPFEWLRCGVGAGPLLIWGFREIEPEDPAADEAAANSVVEFGGGLYVRAFIDIYLSKIFGVYAGARGVETTLSFEDASGTLDIDGWQFYVGLSLRL
jgi:hypothetical protein